MLRYAQLMIHMIYSTEIYLLDGHGSISGISILKKNFLNEFLVPY